MSTAWSFFREIRFRSDLQWKHLQRSDRVHRTLPPGNPKGKDETDLQLTQQVSVCQQEVPGECRQLT